MDCFVNGELQSPAVCPASFQPVINSDVSGIGVRVSFYLQTLFLALSSARANELDEITGALYTLIVTSIAMTVTSLILAFKRTPTLTLHDSLVVCYLLVLSWSSVYVMLPRYNRFVQGDKFLQLLSVIQSYLLLAFALSVLSTTKTFGASYCCNESAKLAIFRPFPLLPVGRIIGWIIVVFAGVIYTSICALDCLPTIKTLVKRLFGLSASEHVDTDPEGAEQDDVAAANDDDEKAATNNTEGFKLGIDGKLIVEILTVLTIWGVLVANTELLIKWNDFQDSTDWQFGQILPMFLIVLPVSSAFKAYYKHRLEKRPRHRRERRARAKDKLRRDA